MSGLGDVLELLHTAALRPKAVRATLHEWANLRLWDESARRYLALLPSGSSTSISARNQVALPEIREGTYRIWHKYPGELWRIESDNYLGARVTVRNDKKWWHRDGGGGLRTNDRAGRTETGLSVHGDRLIEMMLDPSSLLAIATLETGEESMWAGRPAMSVVARWRTSVDLSHVDWPYADSTELMVDRDYGVLLRLEFLLSGEPFMRWQVEEIAFDEDLPDSMFGPLAGPPLPDEPPVPADDAVKSLLDEFRAMGEAETPEE